MLGFPERAVVSGQFDAEVDTAARVVHLFGELDGVTVSRLLATVNSFLASSPGDLILDLDGITFADSALLTAIAEIQNRMDHSYTDLRLVNRSKPVRRLFAAASQTGVWVL